MSRVIYRTEDEGLPGWANGYVVARDETGRRVTWFTTGTYERTTAEYFPIDDAEWLTAIERAVRVAGQTGGTVFVIWG